MCEVLTLYLLSFNGTHFPPRTFLSVNCSHNTSFLFRPLTVINIKRHLSKGFEMAVLILEHVEVEMGLYPLAPLCYLTYQFNNLSSAPCLRDDGGVSCC